MNRSQSITTNGLLLCATGILLMLLAYATSEAIRYTVAAGMFSSAFFAVNTAFKNKHLLIPLTYHAGHALGMFTYGSAISLYANNIPSFLNMTAFYLIYYGFSEIIFCLQILNLREKINFKIDIIRFVIGFAIALGAMLTLLISSTHQNLALLGEGVIFVLGGVNLILFKSVMVRYKQTTT